MTIKEQAVNGNLAHNAKAAPAVPSYGEFVMQPKLNGWRILSEVCDGHVNFYSRSGNQYNGKLPAVEQTLLDTCPAGTWLDGEVVTPDGWGGVQSLLTTATPGHVTPSRAVPCRELPCRAQAKLPVYVVFDLVAHRCIDARPLPYGKRRKLLERIFDAEWSADAPVQLISEFPCSPGRHDAFVAAGYEGSITRSVSARYASGKRGHGVFKCKATDTEDVVVMGFEAGKDVGAVKFGQFRDGKLVPVGTCKRKPDLIPTPDLMEWVGRVIEVRHNGRQKSGALLHPRLEKVRDDKPALDCLWA